MVKIVKPYDKPLRVQVKDFGPSRAKQSFKEESDINNILERYRKTGLIEHVNRYQGQYGDVSTAVDYQSALNIVKNAEMMFDSLPSHIRNQFQNDPMEFLAFAENPENEEKMVELGLKEAPEVPYTAPPAVPDPVPAPGAPASPAASPSPSEAP